jgi:hypothetical protein
MLKSALDTPATLPSPPLVTAAVVVVVEPTPAPPVEDPASTVGADDDSGEGDGDVEGEGEGEGDVEGFEYDENLLDDIAVVVDEVVAKPTPPIRSTELEFFKPQSSS